MSDFLRSLVLMACGSVAITFIVIAFRLFLSKKEIWKRNQEALALVKKWRQREAKTHSEIIRFEQFREQGVIEVVGMGMTAISNNWTPQVRLSDRAINELWE